ncbi:MAG: HAD family hydrolase [archaeon]
MIKSVFFDLDDTLIATYEEAYRNHLETTQALGLEMPPEHEFFKHYGLPWKKLIQALWPSIPFEKFSETYGNNIARYPLIAGADHILTALKSQNLVLGILTTREAHSANILLEKHNIAQYFDLVVCCAEHIHKPDPRSFDQVLHKLHSSGIKKEELLYTGDSLNDFKAAYHARIHFVGVLTGYTRKDDFINEGLSPENIIDSVHHLPLYVKEFNKRLEANPYIDNPRVLP